MATSTAKLAQGTQLAIAGTPGSAITVTAATKAKPCVVTATNTLNVGDVVVFPSGGLTGMPEIGGMLGIVTVASGSSFTVNIDASGFAAAATGGTCVPQTWVTVANVRDFNGFTGTVSEVDKSNLASAAKEYSPGLEDFGSITFNMDLDPTDAGQLAMMAAKSTSAITYFRLKYPNATVARAATGFVKKLEEQGQVDGVYKVAGELRLSGRVSRQEVVV